jgi:hypothetical protein
MHLVCKKKKYALAGFFRGRRQVQVAAGVASHTSALVQAGAGGAF